jgi:hypothetical protein
VHGDCLAPVLQEGAGERDEIGFLRPGQVWPL